MLKTYWWIYINKIMLTKSDNLSLLGFVPALVV